MNMRKISPRNSTNGNTATPTCLCNIVILGSLGVGKSAMTVKFITRRFIMEYDPYLEDTYCKQETLDGQEVMINIMDTYDRDEVSEADRYFKWADVVYIVYSITNRESFEKAKEYVEACNQYQRSSGRDLLVALIGNKVDLERYRQVSNNEGNAVATETDCLFYETTTAEEFELVQGIFHETIRIVMSQNLLTSEDKMNNASVNSRTSKQSSSLKRPKSPKPTSDMSVREGTGIQKKNGSSFKLFNKSFKIFN